MHLFHMARYNTNERNNTSHHNNTTLTSVSQPIVFSILYMLIQFEEYLNLIHFHTQTCNPQVRDNLEHQLTTEG